MNRPQKKTNSVSADQHDSDSRGIGVPPMKDPRSWPGRPCHFKKQQDRNDDPDLMKKMRKAENQRGSDLCKGNKSNVWCRGHNRSGAEQCEMRNEDSRRSRPSSFILHPSSFFSGFTFVELVVALSIGAMVVAVAVIAYGTIGSAGISKREVYVDLSSSYLYLTALPIAVSEAPSFAATAQANILRERFLQDVSSATAVVCLARNLPNSIRPTNFIIPTNIDARTLVTPEDFRTKLIDKFSNAYTSFSTNAINGASLATNLSIYVLYSGANATNITVDAIYEADWVTVTNAPVGVYATVRRFSWGTNMTACTNMTDFYHVFYPDATNNAFRRPVAAFFSRTNTAMTNSYSKASNQPFYFVWWPDPSRRHLNSDYPLETNSTDPRSDFMNHSGGTSYFFAVPAFPAL